MKNKTRLLIFLVFLSTESCSTKITESSSQSDPFLLLVGDTVILNEQLTISSFEDSIVFTDQPIESVERIENFAFDLINQSDENIIFTNTEFNVRAFKRETNSIDQIEWKEIILPIITPNIKVILYPDSTSNIGINTVAIWILMIQDLDFDDNVRFYVSGCGEDTGNEYGAFIDVELIRND